MNRFLKEGAENKSVFDLRTIGILDDECRVIQRLVEDMGTEPAVESIYLYGSYARSEQKPYSDIDIAVITVSPTPTRKEKERIGSYSSKKCDVQVFSDLPLPVQMQVLSQGIPLIVKHPDFLRRLICHISLTYMDQEPMRNRFRKHILRAGNEFI